MIDEMICAFDSPGSVSKVLIIALLSRDPTNARGADTGATNNGNVPRGFCTLCDMRSELVGCGVRLGHQMPAASLQRESARAMPMPNYQ